MMAGYITLPLDLLLTLSESLFSSVAAATVWS